MLVALPADIRVVPIFPFWLERAAELLALLWFINLVNFMDGIDWITVAEVVPVSGALAVFGMCGALPESGTLVAAGLCGATIGFAPFNRPVARLFLGDVGSLPIGLLLGWLLVLLAGQGHLAAAVLLPLYYLEDATITLFRRLFAGEPIMQAHRSHYYQRAKDAGIGNYRIVGRIFAVNVILVALAAVTLSSPALLVQCSAVAAGGIVVTALLWSFRRRAPDAA